MMHLSCDCRALFSESEGLLQDGSELGQQRRPMCPYPMSRPVSLWLILWLLVSFITLVEGLLQTHRLTASSWHQPTVTHTRYHSHQACALLQQ